MAIFYTDSGSFNNVLVSGSTVISASKGIALQVKSSGSTIFSVSGSQGEIFNISDIASSTALFTVASGSTNILNIDNTKAVSVSGSLVVTGSTYIKGLTTSNQSNVVTVDTTTGLLYYTASSAFGGGGSSTPTFPYTGSAIVSGSLIITGSTTSTLGFTGSLYGTASYAVSASNALTASYVNPLRQNILLTGSLLVTQSNISTVDYIDFSNKYDTVTPGTTPTHTEGRLFYDTGSQTLCMYNGEIDVTLNIGQESWLRARNQTGVTITNGSVVKLSGAVGNRPSVALAQATDQVNIFSTTNDIIGMATHDIEQGTDGFITTFGLVNGVNTAAFTAGDLLWVSSSAGQYTNVAPSAPIDKTFVGVVTRANVTNGSIFVFPQQPLHFHDLSSVSASSAYTQGDIWMFKASGSSGVWTNTKILSGSYTLSGSLTTNESVSVQTLTASVVSASSGITGSLFGTASWATSATTASRITSSGVFGPNGANSILSASYALTASTVVGMGSYNVTQSFSNSSTWTFNHNLGYKSIIVQAYDSTDAQIIPQDITLTNNNTATITFPTNETGYAIATVGGALALSTASYTQTAVTASFASTASSVNALNQAVRITGSVNISGSITLTSGSVIMPQRPAFRVIGNSSTDRTSTILSGSAVTVDYNQGNYYNNTNGLFTAPVAGLYQVFFNGRVGSVNAQMQVIVYKNTSVVQFMWEAPGLAASTHFGIGGTVSLAANDTLNVRVTAGTIQFDGNDSWGAAYIG